MPAARRGALRSGSEPVDRQALPPAVAAAPEPRPDAVARHRKRHKHRLTPILRNTIPARADTFDGELDKPVAVRLRSDGACHLRLEVGFWQRPGWSADMDGRRRFSVDGRPAPFEQRQRCVGEVDDAVDQGWRLHFRVAQGGVRGKRFPTNILGHLCAFRRLEAARRPAQVLVTGNGLPAAAKPSATARNASGSSRMARRKRDKRPASGCQNPAATIDSSGA
jgi:hypothetical protein